ncbi:MAG: PEP-CTERM sorting domain-containing protein [Haliea sp.]|nr:PEP-CTERM sorting domain-containing protein [Haliea sp.]
MAEFHQSVPVPASLPLVALGLVLMGAVSRRRNKVAA